MKHYAFFSILFNLFLAVPYSSGAFDKDIASVISRLKPLCSFLDIGAGAGKYGRLVRRHAPKAKRIGLEIESDYIRQFRLKGIYDDLWVMPAQDLISPTYVNATFDLVMIGDTIEHLRKSDGVDLLNFLVYRSKWIIVQFPERYIQNTVGGHVSEAHISVWGDCDFNGLDRTAVFKKRKQRLVVIKGFLKDRLSLQEVEAVLTR